MLCGSALGPFVVLSWNAGRWWWVVFVAGGQVSKSVKVCYEMSYPLARSDSVNVSVKKRIRQKR